MAMYQLTTTIEWLQAQVRVIGLEGKLFMEFMPWKDTFCVAYHFKCNYLTILDKDYYDPREIRDKQNGIEIVKKIYKHMRDCKMQFDIYFNDYLCW